MTTPASTTCARSRSWVACPVHLAETQRLSMRLCTSAQGGALQMASRRRARKGRKRICKLLYHAQYPRQECRAGSAPVKLLAIAVLDKVV